MKKNRAKNAFEVSLIKLIKIKKFEDISVNEIINLSTYSKASFYSYFEDKYDLAQKIIDDEAESLEKVYYDLSREIDDVPLYDNDTKLITILNHIHENKDLYHIIVNELVPGYTIKRFEKVTNSIYEKYGTWIKEYNGIKVNRKFLVHILNSLFYSVVSFWDKNNYQDSPESICEQYNIVLKTIIEGNSLINK